MQLRLKKTRSSQVKSFAPPVLIIFLLVLFPGIAPGAELLDAYKSGKIVLSADPGYGQGNDWDELFTDQYKRLGVAPDGSVFVTGSRQHKVHIFDPAGKLTASFGQRGEGPGDLYHPGKPMILDGKFVAITEYALKNRISLFDLTGKFVKILKTRRAPFKTVSLANRKIAYANPKFDRKKKTTTYKIYIKNTSSQKESFVAKFMEPYVFIETKKITVSLGGLRGRFHLARTAKGRIVAGVSNSPILKVYGPGGKFLYDINLKIKPVPVTSKYIKGFQENLVEDIKKDTNAMKHVPDLPKIYAGLSLGDAFDKHLPYYSAIITDSTGNLLVFKNRGQLKSKERIFQVYSPEGEFICETRLQPGKFRFPEELSGKNIAFTSYGIFALLELKGCDDICLRLVKTKL